MPDTPLQQVSALGQSVWVDFLSRQALEDGTIERLMRDDAVVGLTSTGVRQFGRRLSAQ